MSLIKEFSIQLYSVRDVTDKDFTGTLEKLAQMGYTGVEFAGYGGLDAQKMKSVLLANNLKSVGAHIGLEKLTGSLDEEIAYHKVLGTQYLICPNSHLKTKEDTLKLAEVLTPVVKKINESGMKFAYHNHAHEFVKEDGEYLLDILFDNLPKEAIMELDLFWVKYADVDIYSYMEKNKDRLKLIHVKQIDNNKKGVDVDQGIIDYKEVITKAKILGVEQFILEQEEYPVSSMVSVKNGIDCIMSF
ncbi:MAG: sugar phosphate isomerase/epimerase [Treponema sp.]|nr:sugar phosphate isomerase/epimerase [Treponema sp.]